MTAIRPFRHFGLKVLALGLAALLWMVVSGEATVERGLPVPLELQQFPPTLELSTPPPSTVDVRVRGGSSALGRLQPSDIVAFLDLHGTQAGQRLFPITPDQVRVPFGIEIVQITPPTIALTFERSATKLVPVVPAIEGRPAPGFIIAKVTSDPANVEIVGPESSVNRAAAALTEQVSVAGARARVRAAATVGMLDSTLRLTTTRMATVDVQILPAPLERVVRGLPVHWRQLSPNLVAQFVPATVDVTIRGTYEALDRLGPDDVRAYVDLTRVGIGEYSMPVHGDARDAGVTGIDPAHVQVRITRGS